MAPRKKKAAPKAKGGKKQKAAASAEAEAADETKSSIPASMALRAATALENVLHHSPNAAASRAAIERYVRRVAAPALGRFVLYKYCERGSATHYRGGNPIAPPTAGWHDRHVDIAAVIFMMKCGEYSGCDIPDDVYGESDIAPHRLPFEERDHRREEEAAIAAFAAMAADDDKFLAHSLRDLDHAYGFPGFAGYELGVDWTEPDFDISRFDAANEFLADLPRRVAARLAELPDATTLDFAAYLRAAHGCASVDAIEPYFDRIQHGNEHRVPSTSTTLVATGIPESYTHAVTISTIAFLPAFEGGRPVPITSSVKRVERAEPRTLPPSKWDSGFDPAADYRDPLAATLCAMGRGGSAITERVDHVPFYVLRDWDGVRLLDSDNEE